MISGAKMEKTRIFPDDDLDFEIEFCEAIIREAPRHVDALVLLGELYTKKGLYEKGLEIDRRITVLRPDDPIAHYNLACSYSLLRNRKEAFKALRKSIALGYRDIGHMVTDPDLGYLHNSRRFRWMLRGLGKRIIDGLKGRPSRPLR